MKRILLTGGTGFVGRHLYPVLRSLYSVVAASRSVRDLYDGSSTIDIGELSAQTEWRPILIGVDCVVHVAGRAHILKEAGEGRLAAFRKVNVEGTLRLASQAAEAGVKRFIFISSIGVHGAGTEACALTESSPIIPHTDYAVSKMEAESGLRMISETSGMELVVIRPPLVYAGNSPGNFHLLMKLVSSGLPLPFRGVRNQRSMISLENLIDFISICIEHPAASNQDFLVSDGVDVSTPQIVRYLAAGMERSVQLFPVPDFLLRTGATLLGRKNAYHQLCNSLVIDSSKSRSLLGWAPLSSPAEAISRAGRDYISSPSR